MTPAAAAASCRDLLKRQRLNSVLTAGFWTSCVREEVSIRMMTRAKDKLVRTVANLPDPGAARIRASISMTPALCKASRAAVTIETFLIDLSTPTSDSDSRSLTAETRPDDGILKVSEYDKLGRV